MAGFDFDALEAGYQPFDINPVQQTKKVQKKKGNFLTSLIPTAGGTAGALGGAAAGAALGSVVPIAGTAVGGLIGAILGGAGGSALGKVGENAVEGQADLSQGVGQEALLGGLTSTPIGAGVKLARAGVKAATGFGSKEVGQLVREAGQQSIPKLAGGLQAKAAEEVGIPGVVAGRSSNLGTDLQRRVANTGKVSDSYTQETGIVDALNRNGLKGSATNMYKNLDGTLGNISGKIQNELGTITTMTPRATVVNTLKSSVTDVLPDDPTYTREIARSLDRIAKSGAGNGDVSPSELFKFKQDLGNRLSPAFKKIDRGAALTSKEEVDMALWRNIDNEITRVAPGVKDLTMDQSRLITARPGLQAASNQTVGVPILGIKSQKLAQGTQAAQNKLGRTLNGSAGRSAGQGIVGTAARESLLLQRPSLTDTGIDEQTQSPMTLEDSLNTLDPNVLTPDMQQEPSNPFGVSLADVAGQLKVAIANGDQKGYATLSDLYDKINDYESNAGGSASKPLSAESAKTAATAQSGLSSLDQLTGLISQSGVPKGTIIPGRDLLGGAGASILGTSSYDAAADNVADAMVRLRTGAAATKQELQLYRQLLPQAFDSDEVKAQKIQAVRSYLGQVQGGIGSAGTDTQAMLGQ